MTVFLKKNSLYIATFLFLIIYWRFFLYSDRPLRSDDWYAIQSWLNAWKVALIENRMPYYVKMFEGVNIWGDKFFAVPYIIASPHILLLKFISIKNFIYVHVLISTSIGFWGIIKFRKCFDLSAASFLTLVLFFFLGGFCTDRISVGHIQNAYYLAIPAFLWLLYDFLHSENTFRKSLVFSLFLFLGLLQGSLHVIYQFIFVLFVFSLFTYKRLPYTFLIVGLFAILSMYFVVPNFFFTVYNEQLRRVFGGYGYASGDSVPLMVNNYFLVKSHLNFLIAVISHFVFSFFRTYSPALDATWEYSIFSSPIILYYFFLSWKTEKFGSLLKNKATVIPVILLLILSIGYAMPVLFLVIERLLFNKFPVIDRLPSRMFIYPFSIAVLFAVIRNNLKIKNWHVIVSLAYLLINSYTWRVDYTLSKHTNDLVLKTEILDQTQTAFDEKYINAVNYSYLFSIVMVITAGTYLYYSRKRISYA